MTSWRLLHGGLASRSTVEEWTTAAARLGRFVPVEVDRSTSGGGAHWEHDTPQALARRMESALADGQVVVLATGPAPHAHHAGDVVARQAVDLLPPGIEGTLVGSMAHGHALVRAHRRHRGLRCLVTPPIVESLGGDGPSDVADALAGSIVDLWRSGPSDAIVAPTECVLGHIGPRNRPLGARPMVAPPFRSLAAGTARGRLLAGSATPLVVELLAQPTDEDVILLLEPATLVEGFLDVLLTSPSASRVRAVLVGMPPWPLDLVADHFAMARRLLARRGPVASVGGFAGTAAPAPLLEIGRMATIDINATSAHLSWHSPTERSSL